MNSQNPERKRLPSVIDQEPSLTNPVSQMATEAQCRSDAFYYWCQETRLPHEPIFHRKLWEYAYILQCLSETGMMSPGRRGLGFGVGKEPLVAVMAARGCQVVATDLDSEEATKQGWASTGQYAATLEALNDRGICPLERFASHVTYRVADMNKIDADLVGFDFVYSSCAFEHLGSIELGLQFVKNSLKCLRPGGIAVHTTEFNVLSNDETIDHQQTVLFRRQDIDRLAADLTGQGHEIVLNYNTGSGPFDRHIDVPPWSGIHLKLQLEQYVTTSLGLLIQKAS
ncbi:class I SAM-dependent methyltransferase [Microcoleus sp. N3A4]|uniref:class I SAM-dependent methyltransferase n=1 Tax=Microcoleus sp. N3A4 TaxID=3055379 RepID=UPI002FD17130